MDVVAYEAFTDELVKIAAEQVGEAILWELLKEAGLFRRMGDAVAGAARRVGQKAKDLNTARIASNEEWARMVPKLEQERWVKGERAIERGAEGIANVGNKALSAVGSKSRLVTQKQLHKARQQAARDAKKVERDLRIRKEIAERSQRTFPELWADAPKKRVGKVAPAEPQQMSLPFDRPTPIPPAVRPPMGAPSAPPLSAPTQPSAHARRMQQLVGQRFATAGRIPGV